MADDHMRPQPASDPPDPERAESETESTSVDAGAVDPATDAEGDRRRAADAETAAGASTATATATQDRPAAKKKSPLRTVASLLREIVIVVVVALVASALLRAFVVQAFFVPSGSMLPTIQLHDRILVSRIGDIDRGEVVVFEDPGNWIPPNEEAAPPTGLRKGLEWIGVLPASGHEHLVKRVIGMPGDHVVCCKGGKLLINDVPVDESDFLAVGDKRADDLSFDVVVPADHIFVLGDNRYESGDSSRRIQCADPTAGFVPMDLVTGRAFAVVWPRDNIHKLGVPAAYDDVPKGQDPPPEVAVVTKAQDQVCADVESQ